MEFSTFEETVSTVTTADEFPSTAVKMQEGSKAVINVNTRTKIKIFLLFKLYHTPLFKIYAVHNYMVSYFIKKRNTHERKKQPDTNKYHRP